MLTKTGASKEIFRPLFREGYLETNLSFLFFQYRLAGPCRTSTHWAAKESCCCGQIDESRLAGKERAKDCSRTPELHQLGSYDNTLLMMLMFYRWLDRSLGIALLFDLMPREGQNDCRRLARNGMPGLGGSLFMRDWLVLKVSIGVITSGYMWDCSIHGYL